MSESVRGLYRTVQYERRCVSVGVAEMVGVVLGDGRLVRYFFFVGSLGGPRCTQVLYLYFSSNTVTGAKQRRYSYTHACYHWEANRTPNLWS